MPALTFTSALLNVENYSRYQTCDSTAGDFAYLTEAANLKRDVQSAGPAQAIYNDGIEDRKTPVCSFEVYAHCLQKSPVRKLGFSKLGGSSI